MKNSKSGILKRYRWKSLFLLAALLLSLSPLSALPLGQESPSEVRNTAAAEPADQELERMISIGTAQVEIIKILIRQGKFEQVMPEMTVILDLNLPDKYEELKGQSAAVAAILLADQKQWNAAHQVLDETFLRMKLNVNKSYVLLFKAKVYNSEGKTDKALETYQLAVALSKQ